MSELFEICQCKGCELPVQTLGMCTKHWRRNRKYGTPFATRLHALRALPVDVRFGRLYKQIGECWEWIGGVDSDGYGLFEGVFNTTRYRRAHRFSWAFHNLSDIPKGMFVCHSCDNPRCVNPEHLRLGTAAENNSERATKGRNHVQRGESGNKAKLTEDQARAILADPRPYPEIAHAYGVATNTISSVKNRVSWAHLEVDHIPKNKRGSGKGNRGSSTRITPEIVREIRTSESLGKDLALKFGVSQQLITAIKKRRCWAHVE